MGIVRQVLYLVVFFFMLALIGRMIIGFIGSMSRDWRPKGAVLVVAEGLFTATDPPLKALQKVIPPLRLGNVQLDLAFTVLFLITSFLLLLLS